MVELLIAQIEDHAGLDDRVVLDTEIVVRESS